MADYRDIRIAKWVLGDKAPRVISSIHKWRERMAAEKKPDIKAQPYKYRHAVERVSHWVGMLPCPENELPSEERARETLLNGWK